MSSTVEIYLRYAGPGQWLAHRVAEALELTSYFYSGRDYVLPVETRRWTGGEGWGQLLLDATDLGRDGEPGVAAGTAYEPYEYELVLELRGAPEQAGRAIFDRLTGLGVPLAYGDYRHVFADFLPGRGVREFAPETDAEEAGRPRWFEPRLHGDPAARWQPEQAQPEQAQPAPPGRVTVFETDGLLQIVPMADEERWLTPVAATRTSVRARDLGLLLGAALGTLRRPGRDDRDAVMASLAAKARLPIEEFARRSVSVELRAERDETVIVARRPRADVSGGDAVSGPVVDELVHRGPAPVEPDAFGKVLLDVIDGLRARLAGG